MSDNLVYFDKLWTILDSEIICYKYFASSFFQERDRNFKIKIKVENVSWRIACLVFFWFYVTKYKVNIHRKFRCSAVLRCRSATRCRRFEVIVNSSSSGSSSRKLCFDLLGPLYEGNAIFFFFSSMQMLHWLQKGFSFSTKQSAHKQFYKCTV
jgi:hypothetical protein